MYALSRHIIYNFHKPHPIGAADSAKHEKNIIPHSRIAVGAFQEPVASRKYSVRLINKNAAI